MHFLSVFFARCRLDAARHVDGVRTHDANRCGDVCGIEPACQDQRDILDPRRVIFQPLPIDGVAAPAKLPGRIGIDQDCGRSKSGNFTASIEVSANRRRAPLIEPAGSNYLIIRDRAT